MPVLPHAGRRGTQWHRPQSSRPVRPAGGERSRLQLQRGAEGRELPLGGEDAGYLSDRALQDGAGNAHGDACRRSDTPGRTARLSESRDVQMSGGVMKGPGVFLAQFMGDAAPFDTLASAAKWMADAGYRGVQIPTWDARCIDLKHAAE